MTGAILPPSPLDAALAIALYLGPPAVIFVVIIWRVWRRLRREREALLKERDACAAEGYPPPDPPATDQPPT